MLYRKLIRNKVYQNENVSIYCNCIKGIMMTKWEKIFDNCYLIVLFQRYVHSSLYFSTFAYVYIRIILLWYLKSCLVSHNNYSMYNFRTFFERLRYIKYAMWKFIISHLALELKSTGKRLLCIYKMDLLLWRQLRVQFHNYDYSCTNTDLIIHNMLLRQCFLIGTKNSKETSEYCW